MAIRRYSVTQGNRYAKDITTGRIPACSYVVSACKRHIDDLATEKKKIFPYKFDRDAAEKVCKFAELQVHVKGVWAGKQIRLEPWQAFCLINIFGWVRKKDGTRRYREVYIEVPRKNGKSALAAIIGLYMLTEDGEKGAEVYSGATSKKQAWEVFGPARKMVQLNEEFRQWYGIDPRTSVLLIERDGAKFEPIIGNPGDGSSPHCGIVDEYHEHKTPDQYDTMITGMGARLQPILLIITTAGTNTSSPCYDKRNQVIKMLNGQIKNDEQFGIIYTIDDNDDWTVFQNWKKANPNFGISVFEDFLKARHSEATQVASRQNIIRTKHLNQWMNSDTAWMNPLDWKKCKHPFVLEDFLGYPCWTGLDLASKTDVADIVQLFHDSDNYYVIARHYLPEATIELKQNTHYQTWKIMDHIIETPGPVIDFDVIEADIIDIGKKFDLIECAYDPFQATQIANHLTKLGITMVEFNHIVRNMSEPMKELEALVLLQKIKHNGDPVLEWMMSNVVAHLDKKDNIYPNKDRPENKIDGVVALIMALDRATRHLKDNAEPEIYVI